MKSTPFVLLNNKNFLMQYFLIYAVLKVASYCFLSLLGSLLAKVAFIKCTNFKASGSNIIKFLPPNRHGSFSRSEVPNATDCGFALPTLFHVSFGDCSWRLTCPSLVSFYQFLQFLFTFHNSGSPMLSMVLKTPFIASSLVGS